MGQHWSKILEDGNTAFKQERYSLASYYYTEVLAETKQNLKGLDRLTKDNFQVVIDFCKCSRLAAKALEKKGYPGKAESIYADASKHLVPFISNFNNGMAYRAFTVTQFKHIFYDLVELYVSSNQTKKLKIYVEEYQPVIVKCAKELSMFSKAGMN